MLSSAKSNKRDASALTEASTSSKKFKADEYSIGGIKRAELHLKFSELARSFDDDITSIRLIEMKEADDDEESSSDEEEEDLDELEASASECAAAMTEILDEIVSHLAPTHTQGKFQSTEQVMREVFPDFKSIVDEYERKQNLSCHDLQDIFDQVIEDTFFACRRGNLAAVKSLSARVNINWRNPNANNRTGLIGASYWGRKAVVGYLLTLPQIDVNLGCSFGQTPISHACEAGREEVVKLLLEDSRVDANQKDSFGLTPLWKACVEEREGIVKMLLASGRLSSKTQKSHGSQKTAAECLRECDLPDLAELVESYERNPKEVALRLRRELNWPTHAASLVYAQMIFLCDGLLKLSGQREPSPAERFFSIASQLHLDLQQLLANRSQGLAGNYVPAGDRELAFISLARALRS